MATAGQKVATQKGPAKAPAASKAKPEPKPKPDESQALALSGVEKALSDLEAAAEAFISSPRTKRLEAGDLPRRRGNALYAAQQKGA